jgi:formylglycine-generating enzyme required for sulfatase activity
MITNINASSGTPVGVGAIIHCSLAKYITDCTIQPPDGLDQKEWEKAARGTDGRLFPWGNTFNESFVAWDYNDSRGGSIAKPASPYGCYDMAGSVWEWTADWYKPYPGNSKLIAEYGEKYKVMRGGSNFNNWSFYITSHRYYLHPIEISRYPVGFRCVKDL